jgi:hypothetical protein
LSTLPEHALSAGCHVCIVSDRFRSNVLVDGYGIHSGNTSDDWVRVFGTQT